MSTPSSLHEKHLSGATEYAFTNWSRNSGDLNDFRTEFPDEEDRICSLFDTEAMVSKSRRLTAHDLSEWQATMREIEITNRG